MNLKEKIVCKLLQKGGRKLALANNSGQYLSKDVNHREKMSLGLVFGRFNEYISHDSSHCPK